MSKVRKRKLVQLLSERADVSQTAARDLLGHVFAVITDELAKGNSVTIPGFGSWRMKVHTPRQGRDPRSGRQIAIPPRTRVAFKAGATLRRRAESSIEPEIFFGEGVARATALEHVFARLFGTDAKALGGEEIRERIHAALASGTEQEAAEFFTALHAADSRPDAADAEPADDEPTDAEPTDAEPTDALPNDAEANDAEPTDDEPTPDDGAAPVGPEPTPRADDDRG